MKTGYIRIGIDRKVYFEYYLLEKPKPGNYCIPRNDCTFRFYKTKYGKALKEYEASKQLIKVSNEHTVGNIYPDSVYIYIENKLRKAKNNDPCKCIIIELL